MNVGLGAYLDILHGLLWLVGMVVNPLNYHCPYRKQSPERARYIYILYIIFRLPKSWRGYKKLLLLLLLLLFLRERCVFQDPTIGKTRRLEPSIGSSSSCNAATHAETPSRLPLPQEDLKFEWSTPGNAAGFDPDPEASWHGFIFG